MRSIRIGQALRSRRRDGGSRTARFVGLVLAGVAFALGVGASEERSAGTDRVTISPEQDALWAKIVGGLTPHELLRQLIPSFMAPFAQVFARHGYVVDPTQTRWNASVSLALLQDGIGLLKGRSRSTMC
jgi:hypothetical protein